MQYSILVCLTSDSPEFQTILQIALTKILKNNNNVELLMLCTNRDQYREVSSRFSGLRFQGSWPSAAHDEIEVMDSFAKLVDKAVGEHLIFIDRNCWPVEDLIDHISHFLCQQSDNDVLYGHSFLESNAQRSQSLIRQPSFSPERLLGHFYFKGLFLIRRDCYYEVGGLHVNFGDTAIYDLVLRCLVQKKTFGCVEAVLHHQSKPIQSKEGLNERAAVEIALKSLGQNAKVIEARHDKRQIVRKTVPTELVSVVIPTAGRTRLDQGVHVPMIESCIDSIYKKSTYELLEIIVVHDNPDMNSRYFSEKKIRVIPYNKQFNFADKCNIGVLNCKGSYVIILNDDIEVISENWIETLIGHLQDESVALSGPMLLYEDGTIQSAGIVHDPGPKNYCPNAVDASEQVRREIEVAREVSGITGACVALRKSTFLNLGGLSLKFHNNFNDLDLNYKAQYMGQRIIWTPHAQLRHYESQSRDPSVLPAEYEGLRSRWGRYFGRDLYTDVGH